MAAIISGYGLNPKYGTAKDVMRIAKTPLLKKKFFLRYLLGLSMHNVIHH